VKDGLVLLEVPTLQILLIVCYVVPDSSARRAVWAKEERAYTWQAIEDVITERAHSWDILLVGDPNARVGNRMDQQQGDGHGDELGVGEWDVRELWVRERNPDPELNDNGRKALELCRTHGLLVANGRAMPAEFTRFERRSGSVPDTWLGTPRALRAMTAGIVHELTEVSDHTPMSFKLGMGMAAAEGGRCSGGNSNCYPVMVRSSVTRVAADPMAAEAVRHGLANDEDFRAVAVQLRELNMAGTVLSKDEVSKVAGEFYDAVNAATAGWVKWG
jgi:hypothetical protein